MNRVRYITAMSLAFAFAACSDDGTTIKGNSCELPKVECSGTCTDLGAMHWSDCGVCAEGYADADSDATNGCEVKADGENPGGNSGDCAFINGGVVHGGIPDGCIYECLVFDLQAFLHNMPVRSKSLAAFLSDTSGITGVYKSGSVTAQTVDKIGISYLGAREST